jgi:CHASE3 domain sensor protein
MGKRKILEKTVKLRIREEDLDRLKIISDIHGTSLSGTIRAAIRAMAEQLGIPVRRRNP